MRFITLGGLTLDTTGTITLQPGAGRSRHDMVLREERVAPVVVPAAATEGRRRLAIASSNDAPAPLPSVLTAAVHAIRRTRAKTASTAKRRRRA